MNSRELVYSTLAFQTPPRAPRDLWLLPWAEQRYPNELAELRRDFPPDFVTSPEFLREPPKTFGKMYETGDYVDAWGCTFHTKERGVLGEVREPVVLEEDWGDADAVRFPLGQLTVDRDAVNRFCASSERFVLSDCCPRPFERLQFLRGSEQLYVDLMLRPAKMMEFIRRLHAFYCEQMSIWAKTDVDALFMMDDWGAQKSLLINPVLWRELFLPLYRDYIDIAHAAGKKIFMHSDGYTLDIIPDLVGLGLDALNAQIFCIGLEKLEPYAGRITFWGEIDRQYLLPYGTPQEVRSAVRTVQSTLWRCGGCIAQMEFGAGARPENVRTAFEEWSSIFTAGDVTK